MLGSPSRFLSGPCIDRGLIRRQAGAAVPARRSLVYALRAQGYIPDGGQSRSLHPGGVNVCLGDGSVRFIKNSISQGEFGRSDSQVVREVKAGEDVVVDLDVETPAAKEIQAKAARARSHGDD